MKPGCFQQLNSIDCFNQHFLFQSAKPFDQQFSDCVAKKNGFDADGFDAAFDAFNSKD
jgi:hypothetical protein